MGHRRARHLQRAGAVLVPLNTRFKGAEAAYILDRADVRLLFTVTDFLATNYVELLRGADPVESLREIVVLRGSAAPDTVAWSDFLERADRVIPEEVAARRDALTGDDLCNILFTSGTTGRPKGAMLTHGASVRAYTAWSDVVGLREGDRYLVVNPFFHSFGLNAGILASVLKGAAIIPHAVFDVDQVMQRAAEEQVSMLPGPPTIYQSILDHPRLAEFDMTSLRLAVTGAAPVPVELIRRMRAELGFETIVTGYGLTEATGIATMCRHDDDPETISRTSGRAIPDTEVLVVDDGGAAVAAGRAGRHPRARLPHHEGLHPRPGGHRRGRRRRRLAAHRRRRDARRSAATSPSPGERRRCSSSAGSTRTRPRSRT